MHGLAWAVLATSLIVGPLGGGFLTTCLLLPSPHSAALAAVRTIRARREGLTEDKTHRFSSRDQCRDGFHYFQPIPRAFLVPSLALRYVLASCILQTGEASHFSAALAVARTI